MGKFIYVDTLMEHIKKNKFTQGIDKLSFLDIFFIWLGIVILFGFIFYIIGFIGGKFSYLLYTPEMRIITDLKTCVYFSFITAIGAGFGSITPIGVCRVVATFEAVGALLILAMITSKLVSVKQGVILNEVYELSFNEKISRLRSSLLLFRQNLSRVITRIDEGTIKKREIGEIYVYLSSFEDVLNEINSLFSKERNEFAKSIDPINTELILNSVLSSFEKLNETIIVMNQNNLEWKRDITLAFINKCIALNEGLFSNITSSRRLLDKIINELILRKKNVISNINTGISASTSIEIEKKKDKLVQQKLK